MFWRLLEGSQHANLVQGVLALRLRHGLDVDLLDGIGATVALADGLVDAAEAAFTNPVLELKVGESASPRHE